MQILVYITNLISAAPLSRGYTELMTDNDQLGRNGTSNCYF